MTTVLISGSGVSPASSVVHFRKPNLLAACLACDPVAAQTVSSDVWDELFMAGINVEHANPPAPSNPTVTSFVLARGWPGMPDAEASASDTELPASSA